MFVAVSGSNGLLGQEVVRVFQKEYDVIELPHNRLDISDLGQGGYGIGIIFPI